MNKFGRLVDFFFPEDDRKLLLLTCCSSSYLHALKWYLLAVVCKISFNCCRPWISANLEMKLGRKKGSLILQVWLYTNIEAIYDAFNSITYIIETLLFM